MSRIVIRAFEPADIAAAAGLLAARHQAHRRNQPLLSPRYEEPAAAAAEVSAACHADQATGAVALIDGEVTGFLLGAPKSVESWGPNVWVEAAGHAVREAETARDLYAVAAAGWVEQGRTAHYVLLPAHDRDLVDAWFRLGFGQQHVHAVRPVPELQPAPIRTPATEGAASIRLARRDDIDALAELELVLPAHQGLSPVFSSGPVPTLDEVRAEWEADFDDSDFTTFVAVLDGRVVGSAVGCAIEKSSAHRGPARPDRAGFLGFAAVRPDHRGHGVGRALGEAVLRWAAEVGYVCVVTDWRATNLLSSRTWPRLGFEPTFLRLHRAVGY